MRGALERLRTAAAAFDRSCSSIACERRVIGGSRTEIVRELAYPSELDLAVALAGLIVGPPGSLGPAT